ncbi:MAG: hypothetical protein NTW87_09795 [Planctomycetota bacterium]|nr:hypothetical protein [Planctomycetota bacterium]
MTDDPTMPLPKPPSQDPGETLRPVRPAVPGGETEAVVRLATCAAAPAESRATVPALAVLRRAQPADLSAFEDQGVGVGLVSRDLPLIVVESLMEGLPTSNEVGI